MNKYEKRGVSAEKKEVHAAIKNLDKGLFANAFCKILPDLAASDPDFVNIMHADTAGTKTSLAYLYWKETGDLSVWEGIVQDAIVMNLDDMACVGATNDIIISSTIGRNKNKIPGEVIKAVIEGNQNFIERLKKYGINIILAGGETADVGDIVRTIDVGITAFARLPREKVIEINVQPGDVIIGAASYGQAIYEQDYNSGIGSNGLTFARHETLHHSYADRFPESFDPAVEDAFVYSGKARLTDASAVENKNIGQLLLSPTRTFLPVINKVVSAFGSQIHGMVHCTGGGQTKVLHFVDNLHIIKDNLLPVPAVFKHIQEQNNTPWKELFQVFNMGTRLEFYVPQQIAPDIIKIIHDFGIDAQQIGRVEVSDSKKLSLNTPVGNFEF